MCYYCGFVDQTNVSNLQQQLRDVKSELELEHDARRSLENENQTLNSKHERLAR